MRTAVTVVLLMLTAPLTADEAQQREIQVAATGEVVTVPDMAIVTISVTERDKDANVAQTRVNRVTTAALAVVDGLGVEDRDVTATVMQLHPVYRRPRNPEDLQTIEAFEARRTITVRVRDLARLGDLVNGALERGINGIQPIQLDTSERTNLERQALDLAIDEAKREAAQVARRFGVELGPLTRATVGAPPAQPRMGRAAMAYAAEEMPFRPGEMTIVRQVSATFAIVD